MDSDELARQIQSYAEWSVKSASEPEVHPMSTSANYPDDSPREQTRLGWWAAAAAILVVAAVGTIGLRSRGGETTVAATPPIPVSAKGTGTQLEVSVTIDRDKLKPGDSLNAQITLKNVSAKPFSWAGSCNFANLAWVDYSDSAAATAGLDAETAAALNPDNGPLLTRPAVQEAYMHPSSPCTDSSTLTEMASGESRTLTFDWKGMFADQAPPNGPMVVRVLNGNDKSTVNVAFAMTGSTYSITTNQARNSAGKNSQLKNWIAATPHGTTFGPSNLRLVRGQWTIEVAPASPSVSGSNAAKVWVDATTGTVTDVTLPLGSVVEPPTTTATATTGPR